MRPLHHGHTLHNGSLELLHPHSPQHCHLGCPPLLPPWHPSTPRQGALHGLPLKPAETDAEEPWAAFLTEHVTPALLCQGFLGAPRTSEGCSCNLQLLTPGPCPSEAPSPAGGQPGTSKRHSWCTAKLKEKTLDCNTSWSWPSVVTQISESVLVPPVTQSDYTFGRRLLCRGKGLPSRPGSQQSPCLPAQRTSTGSGVHPSPHCEPGSCHFTGQVTNWWPDPGTKRCSSSATQYLVGATLLTDPRNSPSGGLLPCWRGRGEWWLPVWLQLSPAGSQE